MKIALLSMVGGESLGLASIATYLEKKGGFNEIRVFDPNFDDLLKDTVKYKPDIIGISSFTIFYGKAIELAKKLRKKTNAKIIIGGCHISTLPSSFDKMFDLGVIGEGEITMFELMEHYLSHNNFEKSQLKNINGLVFFEKNKLIITPKRENIANLDELPIINRKYVNQTYYTQSNEMAEYFSIAVTLETARGCPYECVFCSPSVLWGRTRLKSIDRVITEIKSIHQQYGIKSFMVSDDLFICSESRINELVQKLKKEKLLGKVEFTCFARANLINDKTCKLLKKMNVKLLSFGFESGSDKVLKFLKGGNVTVEDNRRAIRLCKKYDFLVSGNILFASPGETIEDMKQSLDFIDYCIKNKIKGFMNVFILTPFPGTPIWEIAKKRKKVSDNMNWDELRHQNWEKPLLLDEDIDFKEFQKTFEKAKTKMRYFHRQVWIERFKRNPLRTLKLVFSGGRILKYLFINRQK